MAPVIDRPGIEPYLAAFGRAARGSEPSWLANVRRSAIDRFAELGFPSTRDEEWRFTSVAPIAEKAFVTPSDVRVSAAQVAPFELGVAAAAQLVFVNGRYVPEFSSTSQLPKGTDIRPLGSVLAERPDRLEPSLTRGAACDRHPFVALNTAFFQDGALVSIPAGAVIEAPVHVLFINVPARGQVHITHPRVLIVIGENSQARIVESYVSLQQDAGEYLTNAVTEIVAGPGSVVDHYKVQREDLRAFHIATMHVQAYRSSAFASHSFTLGGRIVRNDITAVMEGEGIDCTLNGLYLADGERLVDNHTTIDHALPHCGSHEVYKGILAGRARAVFNGKIVVRPDAQKTDAKQTNKALLLSDDASINTKPQLEIFANDVKCTHGAAIGQLDEDAMFYLRARGIGVREARDILVHAFAGQILDRVQIEPLRRELERAVSAQLPG